ncbi:Bestrophin-like protein [Aphelenchoides fujianensis]|nr:Bestrophin-like protein [Aphelenchoides fujianensis]
MAPLSQNPQPASPESKSARRGVHEAPDFQRLLDETTQDVDAMLQTATLASTEILDTSVPLNDRIRRFGTLIGCTLLAHEHRGGYLVRTNTQQLLGHLDEDFGIRGAEIARRRSASRPSTGSSKARAWPTTAVPFQNEFLSELLVQQEEGKMKVDKKELDKKLDRAARLQANKMTPESIDARIRIYTCMQAVGAEKKLRPYGDVQAEYLRVHQKMLNKAELKSAFGIGEPTNVFRECCFEDVHVQEDAYKTGLFHVQLKRPLSEIIEEYEKVKEEVANSTLHRDFKKLQQYNYEYYNRGRERPEKKKSDRKTPELAAHVDVVPEYMKPGIAAEGKAAQSSGQSTSKSAPSVADRRQQQEAEQDDRPRRGNVQRRGRRRGRGVPPAALLGARSRPPRRRRRSRTSPKCSRCNAARRASPAIRRTAPKKAPKKEPPRLAPAKRPQRSEVAGPRSPAEVRQPEPQSGPSHVQEVRPRTKSPPPPISNETAALIHAYVTGFLSSLFPALYTPLLGRWRGSVYKLMVRELISFLAAYYLVAAVYRYVFDESWQRRFENFATYCREFTSVVPITFVLGFYLSFVVGRWWQVYLSLPWPDKLAIEISALDQQTSTIIKKRFPSFEHLVEAGIMTAEEKLALESTPTPHGLWWIPAHWFGQLAMIARKEGRIHDDLHLKSLIDDSIEYRNLCGTVWSYDWISVPLAYTQVVAIAVYSFFLSCLFGRQYLLQLPPGNDSANHNFLFYVGWLKVAESMICPLGSDDDDFELNWIIDRNIQVSYLVVDQLYRNTPKALEGRSLERCRSRSCPTRPPRSRTKKDPFFGSTTAMNISEKMGEWNLPDPALMAPIDEEAGIGLREALNSIDSKLPQRRSRMRKGKNRLDSPTTTGTKEIREDESENGGLSESQTADLSSEDEGDADQRSNGSTQYEAKHQRGRLGGLPLGVSRQTMSDSKHSLNSRLSRKRSSMSKFSMQRSPQSSISRPKSIGSRPRLNARRSRGSSPTVRQHRDGIPDDHGTLPPTHNQTENRSQTTDLTHKSPVLPEEPEPPLSESNEIRTKVIQEAALRSAASAPARVSQMAAGKEEGALASGDSTSRTPLIPVEEETR